jgi:3-hydroxyisobutyrate dehydrogenase-like beta-hydroxyacid dehydrogenase
MKIGFIGMGIMGSRMAANLQKKGHDLVIHNRTRRKAEPLIAQGATWAETPAELAKQTGIVITMLSTPDAVEQTALGAESGFLYHLQKNALWIDSSTVNPSFSKRMADAATKRGIRFIDAPVAGSKGPAEQAQLLFFAGGDKADIDEVKPLFEAMGKAVFHLGGHGAGTSMKMVNNIILAQAMAAFSEAMALGESLGLARDMLFNTLLTSPVTAPFLAFKRSKIEAGNYEVEFPLQWMHKDMKLATDTAYETGVPLPLSNAAKEVYASAVKNGLGEQDFSAVFKVLGMGGH